MKAPWHHVNIAAKDVNEGSSPVTATPRAQSNRRRLCRTALLGVNAVTDENVELSLPGHEGETRPAHASTSHQDHTHKHTVHACSGVKNNP